MGGLGSSVERGGLVGALRVMALGPYAAPNGMLRMGMMFAFSWQCAVRMQNAKRNASHGSDYGRIRSTPLCGLSANPSSLTLSALIVIAGFSVVSERANSEELLTKRLENCIQRLIEKNEDNDWHDAYDYQCQNESSIDCSEGGQSEQVQCIWNMGKNWENLGDKLAQDIVKAYKNNKSVWESNSKEFAEEQENRSKKIHSFLETQKNLKKYIISQIEFSDLPYTYPAGSILGLQSSSIFSTYMAQRAYKLRFELNDIER